MITEVKLPEIGSNVEEVTILRWLKVEGDEVGARRTHCRVRDRKGGL